MDRIPLIFWCDLLVLGLLIWALSSLEGWLMMAVVIYSYWRFCGSAQPVNRNRRR